MANCKEKFPKEMAEWIKATYPEYDLKLGLDEAHIPGLPTVPSDDEDLKNWKKAKRDEFEKKFGASLDQIKEWRQRFDRKYLNRTRTLKDRALKSSLPQKQFSILALQEPSAITGRRLFEQNNTHKFSEEATQLRDDLSQSARFHAGHWRSLASAAWNALSDQERAEWEEQARLADQASITNGDIFKNQESVVYNIFNTLQNTIGPRPHQIGCAAYHVLYAYRDKNDELVMGTVQVIDNDFIDVQFDKDFKDYETSVRRTWNSYCSKAVGSNRTIDYAKLFSQSENGLYILPQFDEENGKISDLRQTLKAFLEWSWG